MLNFVIFIYLFCCVVFFLMCGSGACSFHMCLVVVIVVVVVVDVVEKSKRVYPQAWSRRWKRFIRRYQSSFHSITMERGPIPTVPEGLSMSLPKIKYDLRNGGEKNTQTYQWKSKLMIFTVNEFRWVHSVCTYTHNNTPHSIGWYTPLDIPHAIYRFSLMFIKCYRINKNPSIVVNKSKFDGYLMKSKIKCNEYLPICLEPWTTTL